MRFAARLHPHLVRHAWRVDDELEPIAEVWRQVGREADAIGVERPGYHVVREVVRAERKRRAAQREALLTVVDESFAWLPSVGRIAFHLATAYELRRRAP
jgi:hypothetical protein